MRQNVNRRRFRSAVEHFDADAQVFRPRFGILDKYIEIAVVVENIGVEQFVLRLTAGTLAVFFNELRVGKFRLRILVEILHVGMRGRRIQIEIILLHVLPVVPFGWHQAKQSFLQNRIAAIPQRQSKDQNLVAVGHGSQTILAPAIGFGARQIVRKEIPCFAIRAVILPHGAPGPFGNIRPPFLPRRDVTLVRFVQSLMLLGHVLIFNRTFWRIRWASSFNLPKATSTVSCRM